VMVERFVDEEQVNGSTTFAVEKHGQLRAAGGAKGANDLSRVEILTIEDVFFTITYSGGDHDIGGMGAILVGVDEVYPRTAIDFGGAHKRVPLGAVGLLDQQVSIALIDGFFGNRHFSSQWDFQRSVFFEHVTHRIASRFQPQRD